MALRNKKLKGYLIEVLMISLSIFLAFLAEEFRQNWKEKNETKEILSRIKEELEINKRGLENESKYHKKVAENIEKVFSDKSLQQKLISHTGFDFRQLAPKGIMQFLPSNTAWDIALKSNIASKIDHNLMKEFTETYDIQDIMIERVKKTFDIVLNQDFHKKENVKESMIVFALSFGDVYGKDDGLIQQYDKCLKMIENELKK